LLPRVVLLVVFACADYPTIHFANRLILPLRTKNVRHAPVVAPYKSMRRERGAQRRLFIRCGLKVF
jgi:hypothetical protein